MAVSADSLRLEVPSRGDDKNRIDLGLKCIRTEVSAGGGLIFNRTGAVSCEFLFNWVLTDEFDLGERRKPYIFHTTLRYRY